LKIPGSFFKVRSQGGASSKDIDEVNKFYKRSIITMFVLMVHSYITINFLYDARFVTQKRTPKVFTNLPYFVYPVVLAGSIVYMFSENSRMMNALDKKYTPLWLEISKKI
jgi:ABC-type polysaccharide transport system permease subunit